MFAIRASTKCFFLHLLYFIYTFLDNTLVLHIFIFFPPSDFISFQVKTKIGELIFIEPLSTQTEYVFTLHVSCNIKLNVKQSLLVCVVRHQP